MNSCQSNRLGRPARSASDHVRQLNGDVAARGPASLDELDQHPVVADIDEPLWFEYQSVEEVHPCGQPPPSRLASVGTRVRHLRREDKLELVGKGLGGAEVSASELFKSGASKVSASSDIAYSDSPAASRAS